MQLTERLQFKVNKADSATIKRDAAQLRMPLSTYLRLKVLNNEIIQTAEKESYTQID